MGHGWFIYYHKESMDIITHLANNLGLSVYETLPPLFGAIPLHVLICCHLELFDLTSAKFELNCKYFIWRFPASRFVYAVYGEPCLLRSQCITRSTMSGKRNNLSSINSNDKTSNLTKIWVLWWRHEMETISGLLALWSVTRSFVFFDLRVNKRFSKHMWGYWFKMPSGSLRRHWNVKLKSDFWPHPFLSILNPYQIPYWWCGRLKKEPHLEKGAETR